MVSTPQFSGLTTRLAGPARLLAARLGQIARPAHTHAPPPMPDRPGAVLRGRLHVPIRPVPSEAALWEGIVAEWSAIAAAERWADLLAALRRADQARAGAPGGRRLAGLISLGARHPLTATLTRRELIVNPTDLTADARITLETGGRYEFGALELDQDIIRDDLMRAYVRFSPGQPFSPEALNSTQFALEDSNYFSSVVVTQGERDRANLTVPVKIHVEPIKRNRYAVNAGYGTDTGARVKLRAEQRWLNRQGHHAEQELQWSTIKSLVGIKYKIPGADPTTDEYSLTAGYSQQDYNQQDYQLFTLGGGWQQQDGKWLKNYNLNYQYEQFSVGDQPTSSSLLLIPGLNWTWIDADDRLYPTRGLLFGFELRGASTALLSDLNFVQGVLLSLIHI